MAEQAFLRRIFCTTYTKSLPKNTQNDLKINVNIRVKIWFFDVHRVMKPVIVAKILQEALHGILASPTDFITQWTSKNQILIFK